MNRSVEAPNFPFLLFDVSATMVTIKQMRFIFTLDGDNVINTNKGNLV